MLKSKFLTGGAIFVFVIALVGGVYFLQKSTLPEVFSYVPIEMDQVMVNRAERNIQNNTNMLVEIPKAVQDQFQKIKVMILVQDQSFSGQQMVFLQTKGDFSPQDFLKTINPEDDTTSTYLRLEDGVYAFGPHKTIQQYQKPNQNQALFLDPVLKSHISAIKRSSMSIISHDKEIIETQKGYLGILNNAKYMIMHITSDQQSNFDFSAHVVFAKPQTGLNLSFSPQFTSLLKESTIAYVELSKVMAGLQMESTNLSGSLPDLILQKVLTNNFAIIVSQGTNMFNVGLTLVSDDESLFTELEPLFPMVGAWLQSNPMLSGSQITSIKQPGKIGYDVLLQDMQKIGIILEKTSGQTKISIGNPLFQGKKVKLQKYSKESLAVMYVDMKQFLGLYKQTLNIGLNPAMLNESQQTLLKKLEDKTFYGEISLNQDEMSIKGKIE